jgi:3-deoxy-7-phosphoheptulonate synthase
MLIVMRHGAPQQDVDRVVATIEDMGYQARPMPGKQRTTVGLVGNDGRVDSSRLEALPGVQEIIHVTKPYKQVSREWKPESTVVRLPGGLTIGGDDVIVMAGPCSVESERQIRDAARAVRDAGATSSWPARARTRAS